MKNQFYIFAFVLSFTCLVHAQQITGCVNDAKTGEKLSNVSVYFSGTSIGVVTGIDGCFAITYRPELNAPLVLSVLGYDKLTFENPLGADLSNILLQPKVDDLEAVYLNPDPWTRAQKEAWFKKLFLGEIPEASDCTIRNLKEVRLRFNPSTNMLTAVCDVPIVINNKYLGYTIMYDLIEFEAVYTGISLSNSIQINNKPVSGTRYKHQSTYVAGTSFFKELDGKKPSERKREKNREKMYKQSTLRFFRSLVSKTFEEDGYVLYHKGFKVDLNKHVRVKDYNGGFIVEFRENTYSITDSNKKQSEMVLTEQRIIVDKFGNNLSPRSIQFGGHFAKLQTAGLLPLEYGLEN